MALIGVSGKAYSPSPAHPRIRRWYRRLDKPAFTPPGPAFGAAWGLVETLLSVGGYRLMRRAPSKDRDLALGLWGLNNLLIAGWSGLFFGRRALGPSALVSAGMIAAASAYSAAALKSDRAAAASALPLIGWLTFATLLAEEVWRRNE